MGKGIIQFLINLVPDGYSRLKPTQKVDIPSLGDIQTYFSPIFCTCVVDNKTRAASGWKTFLKAIFQSFVMCESHCHPVFIAKKIEGWAGIGTDRQGRIICL